MLKQLIAGVALAVTLAGAAQAVSLDEAVAALYRGDYSTVLQILKPLAEQGDVEAQVMLGILYKAGQGVVPQDDAEAVKWYRLAADQGAATAQYNIGSAYYYGRGLPQDRHRAG